MIQYLTQAEVLFIHRAALAANGGLPGLRDVALLDSAVAQPRMSFGGRDLYPTVIEKAASLGFSLMNNHPFVDGNKRVGWAAMRTFLLLNDVPLRFLTEDGVRIALAIAAGQTSREELVEWITTHVLV
ncbi:Toxin Doc [Caulifigura coniformis]|uniref:Toxin Doc n=1 Tax=Caulifigura coniformis TaxID=2527983 RepID=A0A517S7D1_9PLAN|nr:type II toxin-antitoxin system death-on-curing family toxin [Caulifigura coniformis]QDT52030.1 Toxin Doc [Caulifigura coniformis]